MTRRFIPWAIVLIGITAAGSAHAQPSEGATPFVAIYGGAQPQRHDIVAEQTFPLFDETASVTKSAESGNAFGVNGGLDVLYRVTPALGLGVFVHYVGGKVDLPSASGVDVGGAQGGLVFRVNF